MTPVELAQRVFDAMFDVKTRTGEYPTAVAMNPRDWQLLREDRSATFDYYQGRYEKAKTQLWGLPISEDSAIAPGQFELT